MTALLAGTLLALAALLYVLWPLIAAAERRAAPASRSAYATTLPGEASDDDRVEAEIQRARAQLRVCVDCGPRPEPGALYCSRCGRALA